MNRLLYIAFTLSILTACSNDITEPDTTLEEIRVVAKIEGEAVTRAIDNTWHNGDAIGVSGGTNAYNVKYTTAATDGAASASFTNATQTPIYYNVPASYYDAYYPYQASPTTNTAAQTVFSVATAPANNASAEARKAIDVLWASTSSTVDPSSNVSLTFSHMLAELVITFDWSGTGFSSAPSSWDFSIAGVDQGATVTINHSQYTSSWSSPTCTVEASGSTSAYTVSGWTTNTYTMIIPAQNLSSKAFTVTVEGATYSGALPASFSLAQGTKSTVTIKVSKTGLSVGTARVNAWGDGSESNSTISAAI